MPVKILMPALSPTMTEGNLAKWLKKEGDAVKAGDVIAEIETDKATMEVEAVDEGILGKILVSAGTAGVKVNEVIAVLLEEGEDKAALKGFDATSPSTPAPPSVMPAPFPVTPASPSVIPAKAGIHAEPARSGAEMDSRLRGNDKGVRGDSGKIHTAANTGQRIFASPLAKRMANQAGIDISALQGSGPRGRVVKADVEAAVSGGTAPRRAPVGALTAAPVQITGDTPYRVESMSMMRKIIAQRLTESKQTVPHFYLTVDCEIDKLLEARQQLNTVADGAFKLSVNDFVIRAVAFSLKKVPAANASYTAEGVRFYERADVSVAVATPGGLITPIIKGAEHKGLQNISNEMKDLAERARVGKLMPEEYQGGTFTISNLGMYGIKDFGAIINPPQACILAVGAGEQRAIVKNGQLAVATVMSCTLSVDHRVVDGAVGAEFMKVFKQYIENPLSMLL